MGYSGAGGKLIYEKPKQKISWHFPLKSFFSTTYQYSLSLSFAFFLSPF
jgi:hypothetical protein